MQTTERRDDSDRKIALRIFCFLRGGRNSVKSNVSEKNVSGACANPRKSHGRERVPIVAPVGEIHVTHAQHNDEKNHCDLDDHDAGIESRALLDPHHQNRGDQKRDQNAGRLKPISMPNSRGAFTRSWARCTSSGDCALIMSPTLAKKACVPSSRLGSEA